MPRYIGIILGWVNKLSFGIKLKLLEILNMGASDTQIESQSNQVPPSTNDMKIELVNATKTTARFTKILAIATILLFFVSFLQYQANLKLSESNEILTNITKEFYEYHPPEVSLITGDIDKLYILNNNTESKITIVGIASVYNSGLSDDIALVIQKRIGAPPYIQNEKVTLYGVQGNTTTKLYEEYTGRNYTIYIDGNPIPISVPPKEQKEIPILMTYKLEKASETVELEIMEELSDIEVIHPTNKTILKNITALKPATITYTMGNDKAFVKCDDGISYKIDVRYTTNEETYMDWKASFLRQFGVSSLII